MTISGIARLHGMPRAPTAIGQGDGDRLAHELATAGAEKVSGPYTART